MLYYLTPSRSFNFQSLEIWLSKSENARIVSKIDMALFVESMGSGDFLNFHIYPNQNSDMHSVEGVKKVFSGLSETYSRKVVFSTIEEEIFLSKKWIMLKL